jgi:hypothetical protein
VYTWVHGSFLKLCTHVSMLWLQDDPLGRLLEATGNRRWRKEIEEDNDDDDEGCGWCDDG